MKAHKAHVEQLRKGADADRAADIDEIMTQIIKSKGGKKAPETDFRSSERTNAHVSALVAGA